MKSISIVNSSYIIESKTMKMVNLFISGLKEIIPEIKIKIFNISEWQINTCNGCGNCWFNEPGVCVFKDDFSINIKNIIDSDTLIFSNPIWVGSGNHLYRIFTERMICLVKPDFELNKNLLGHKKMNNTNFNKIILFSSCALSGLHNFSSLVEHYKSLSYLMDIEIDLPVLKPQSIETLYYNDDQKKHLFELCHNLGKEYAKNNTMNHVLLEKIAHSNLSIQEYIGLIDNRQKKIRQNYELKK